ncbi:MAG TPA: hypothetical protein VJ485_00360 [archaeon]|nr:hypothetical protein [archaeon]
MDKRTNEFLIGDDFSVEEYTPFDWKKDFYEYCKIGFDSLAEDSKKLVKTYGSALIKSFRNAFL